ncbi:hypothetical protein KQX54_011924 [Cotesia glomerata]|uniref:Uncharacterized protein n=1 Tax=Cotesia glomerata TaxID=32391 RepID=A0AAV7IP35_COTGL|nr:hypothetical protein KQX54_011924 [Cotesia glomerata]
MKWHLIAAVLLITALIPEEILAKPSRNRSRSRGNSNSSKPKNNPLYRRPSSSSKTSNNPHTSMLGAIPSSSVPQSNPTTSTKVFKRISYVPKTTKQLPIRQSNNANQPSTLSNTRPGLIVQNHPVGHARRPTLQQLGNSRMNPQVPTSVGNPSSANPQPAPANNPPAQVGNPVPGTSGSQPSPQVGNPVPGPSGSQPSAPSALVQAGATIATSSRAAAKAAKAQAKQNKINKIKTNAQAALQQVNANIGTCKDANAPPEACFDFFVLSISWGPATKIKRLGTAAPINKPEWSIHGLWPSLRTYMKHPKQCNLKIPYDPNQVLPIQNELEDKWFSANGSPMTHQALWRHEWEKHGTCAARSPQIKSVKQYFKKGLELFNQANVQAKLTAANFRPKKELTNKDMHDEISRILGHRVTLEFINHPRTSELWLSGIRLCYDFNFLLINCPPATKTLNTENEDTKMIYSL